MRLFKLFDIKKGEGKPATLLFAYFFFFGATLTAGKIARDAYFLNRFDISYLPLMFLLAASTVALIAVINYFVSKRLNLIDNLFRTIFFSGIFFAISLILIQTNLNGLLVPFLYVWVDVITIVINFQFVIYASMVFNSRQAKRLFGIILCGSPIARIVIGGGIPTFVGRFGSNYLLTLTAGFILCCVLMAWIARPYIHPGQPVGQIRSEKPKNVALDSYLKILGLATGAAAVATVIIEYQFLIFSNHAFPSEENLASFFGTFYSVTGFISLFTQLFLTRWILARFGILSAMRILPAGLGVGALAILFNPSLFSALIGRVSEQVTKFTLNKTSCELLWVPISPDQKQRKKLFIDDTIKTGMQGLTGIIIFVIIKKWALPYPVYMQVLSVIALVFIVIWFLATSYLKNGYVSALVSAIEKRHLDFEQMRLDTADSEIVKTIEDALNSDEEAKQIFALELISDLYHKPWSDTLNRLFKKGSPSVKARILTMAADHPDILSDADLLKTIENNEILAGDAMIVAGKHNMKEMIPTMVGIMENAQQKNAQTVAAAAATVMMMNQGYHDLAETKLKTMLSDADENIKATALRMLHHIPDFLTDSQLQEFCVSDSVHVCNAALDIARYRNHLSLIPCVIYCLKFPQTRSVARDILKEYPQGDVIRNLDRMLDRDSIDEQHKVQIIRTLKDYPDNESAFILAQMLKHPSLDIQAESIDALLQIARQKPLSSRIIQQLSEESRIAAKRIFALYRMILLIKKEEGGLLLYDLYDSEIEKRIPMLVKMLVLPSPEIPVETYIKNEKYKYRTQSDNLIEIFDNILPRKESGYVIPLLKDVSIEYRCRAGQRFFDDLPDNLDIELVRLIKSSNEYYRIIGLDYAISKSRIKVLEHIDWSVFINQRLHNEVIAKYIVSNNDALMNLPQFPLHHFQNKSKELEMLSLLEKTIILKSTNLFEGVPGEYIYHVARVMEEKRLDKGACLFERGDKGDYFYIIVTGEILIHIGEKEVNRHGKGEYFGEMALLDDSPRSLSATALEETLLLKINQDNFLDIMMHHKEVRRSILRILNERFRRLTDQYARAIL